MKQIELTIALLLFFTLGFGDTLSTQPAPAGPQVAPSIALQPDQQTQTLIGKLFDNKASYQYFHPYDKVILFKIPSK